MNWIFFAIFAATSFGFYNFFTKITADKFSPTIALMIITGVAFIMSVIATLIFNFLGQPLQFQKNALLRPVFGGLFYGTAVIFYVVMFSKGTPISIGSPFVVGGTTLVATILGLILLGEPLTAAKIVGVLTIVGGLFILGRG